MVMEEVRRWNPRRSFPTIVIDDDAVIVGFKEGRLKEVLEARPDLTNSVVSVIIT